MLSPYPEVVVPGYEIRLLGADDGAAVAAAYVRNREHLAPWEPRRDPDFFTQGFHERDVAEKVDRAREGLGAWWLVWKEDTVVGRVALTNVVRGPFQSAHLGYWVDRDHTGRGLATAGVRHAVGQAREDRLHRVEAGVIPSNTASRAVLTRCGFHTIGTAPRYLFIAGAWQDHVLYQQVLRDDEPSARP